MNPILLDRLDAMEAWVRRRRWWLRLLTLAIVLPWGGLFVYTRMTTMPPGNYQFSWRHDASLVRVYPVGSCPEADIRLFENLPPRDLTTPAANSGWTQMPSSASSSTGPVSLGSWPGTIPSSGRTELDFAEALRGDWDPGNRYHLSKIIEYLRDPKTESALAGIATVASQPVVLPATVANLGGTELEYLQMVTEMFLARARMRLAGDSDFDAAVNDIRIALQLAANLEDDGRAARVVQACSNRRPIMRELELWSREFPLTPDQVHALRQLLAEYRLDWRTVWSRAMRGDAAYYETVLDGYYTKDADGNGWPVICRWNEAEPWSGPLTVLNVLSPVFNDRRTMHHKIQQSIEGFERILDTSPSMGYVQAFPNCQGEALTPVDYIFTHADQSFFSMYCDCFPAVSREIGTKACLAVVAYKWQHGRDPERIDDLVPEYLPAVPMDYKGRQLELRLDEGYGCRLGFRRQGDEGDGRRVSGYVRVGYGMGIDDYGDSFDAPRESAQNEWFRSPVTTLPSPSENTNGNDQGQ